MRGRRRRRVSHCRNFDANSNFADVAHDVVRVEQQHSNS